MRPNFRTNESPIYFLGKMYNGKDGTTRGIELQNIDWFDLETTHDDIPCPPCEQSYANFLKSFSQRIYLSYRKQFEPLNGLTRSGDPITSDCGWGCMIRCAQMLLAQTLLIHMTSNSNLPYSNIQISDKCKYSNARWERPISFLFRIGPKRNSIECFRNANRTNRRIQVYTDIIRLFGDYPHAKCPFGIHQ